MVNFKQAFTCVQKQEHQHSNHLHVVQILDCRKVPLFILKYRSVLLEHRLFHFQRLIHSKISSSLKFNLKLLNRCSKVASLKFHGLIYFSCEYLTRLHKAGLIKLYYLLLEKSFPIRIHFWLCFHQFKLLLLRLLLILTVQHAFNHRRSHL